MAKSHRIGLLLSSDGPYGVMAAASLCGAVLAIEELNARPDRPFELVATTANPSGDLARYRSEAAAILDSGVRHVIGCYTSISRKEVIPLFEKRDALLWYPAHYEGFEASPNVVYIAGAPNQHVLPLVDWLLRQGLRSAYCVGSNYVWAWETNRVFREALIAPHGTIVGERYVAVEDIDVDHIVADILRTRPDFVFCTLIGASAAQFILALRRACIAAGLDQSRDMPLLTCNLTESTMQAIEPWARDGHVISAVYFSSVATAESRAFVAAYKARFGLLPSADSEAAFTAVHLLAQALQDCGSDEIEGVKAAACRHTLRAPQGAVHLDPDSMHAYLTPRIARSRTDGGFDILEEAPMPVRPDPYLLDSTPRLATQSLRLVS